MNPEVRHIYEESKRQSKNKHGRRESLGRGEKLRQYRPDKLHAQTSKELMDPPERRPVLYIWLAPKSTCAYENRLVKNIQMQEPAICGNTASP